MWQIKRFEVFEQYPGKPPASEQLERDANEWLAALSGVVVSWRTEMLERHFEGETEMLRAITLLVQVDAPLPPPPAPVSIPNRRMQSEPVQHRPSTADDDDDDLPF